MTAVSIRSSIFEIPYAVTETLTATLEARERAFCRSRDETSVCCDVCERRRRVDDLAHLLCIRLPVGCESQRAAGRDRFRQQLDEWRLNEPTLVMSLLRPRIGKEDVREIDGRGSELMLQHFHGVVTDHAQDCAVSPLLRRAAGVRRRADALRRRCSRSPDAQWRIRATLHLRRSRSPACAAPRVRTARADRAARCEYSTPYFGHSCASARCWPAVARPARNTKLRTLRRRTSAGSFSEITLFAFDPAGVRTAVARPRAAARSARVHRNN